MKAVCTLCVSRLREWELNLTDFQVMGLTSRRCSIPAVSSAGLEPAFPVP